ncbi:MAG: hypothetical protein U0003_03430 [Vampirovibrionales bacterium]
MSGFFAMVPCWELNGVPNRIKLGLALSLSVVLFTLHVLRVRPFNGDRICGSSRP